jgi:hypothetical protein
MELEDKILIDMKFKVSIRGWKENEQQSEPPPSNG